LGPKTTSMPLGPLLVIPSTLAMELSASWSIRSGLSTLILSLVMQMLFSTTFCLPPMAESTFSAVFLSSITSEGPYPIVHVGFSRP